jgi:hypothetical protein
MFLLCSFVDFENAVALPTGSATGITIRRFTENPRSAARLPAAAFRGLTGRAPCAGQHRLGASPRAGSISGQARCRCSGASKVPLRRRCCRTLKRGLLWRCPLCGVRSDCTGLLTYVPVGHHITKSVQSACRNAISPASVRHGFCILPVLISQRAKACAFICKSTSA